MFSGPFQIMSPPDYEECEMTCHIWTVDHVDIAKLPRELRYNIVMWFHGGYHFIHNSFINFLSFTKYISWSLTHLPLNKMAAIPQTIFSDAFFENWKFGILIKISLKFFFVPKGLINPALV